MMKPLLGGSLASVSLLLAGSPALAETKASADVTVNGGVSTNPYGSSASDTTSGTFAGTLSSQLIFTNPTGNARLSGQVTRTEYIRLYDGTTDYSITGSTAQQIGALTSLTASAFYSSQVRNSLYPVIDPGTGNPDDPDAPVIVDPSATESFAERTDSFNGNLGLSTQLSARDSLSVSGRFARVNFPEGTSTSARSYDIYSAVSSYMRTLNETSSLGFSLYAARTNYQDTDVGDGKQFAPSLVYSKVLPERLSLNVSAGMTFSDTNLAFGSLKQSSFSGSVNLCRRNERSSLCANASRSVSPSSSTGMSIVNSFGANFRYSLTARSGFSARLSYSNASSLLAEGKIKTDYAQVALSYNHQILERLSAVVSMTYSDSFDSVRSQNGNFYGTVGIRYKLGEL